MTKPNAARSTNVNVLAESELEQVVGGYCHRRRHYNYGSKHCGGWRQRDWHGEKSYEAPETESSDYASTDSYESSPTGDTQIVNVTVTIDIAQVQG